MQVYLSTNNTARIRTSRRNWKQDYFPCTAEGTGNYRPRPLSCYVHFIGQTVFKNRRIIICRMAASLDEKKQIQPELIDHCTIDLGETENKIEKVDFCMNRARLAFLHAETVEDPVQNSTLKSKSVELPSEDLHPWLKCCGRNFMRSIFSLQPKQNPRPGFTRRRRGMFPLGSQSAP
ncbi:uncharacterized protein LOC108053869 [Drosophila rhopaloa]|uniref:Uncharacterized protein LOC108053869 n=1 Tax=Drosophila rhopaloa TaxID=1041015 RepID=A0A6P4FQT1_DRORH|nr:uncharacterized protein LOC108053869 [Drosophila rhopaloa]